MEFPYFETFNLYKTDEMFYGCNNLRSLNLTYFFTFNVYNMSKMFFNCTSLKSLDISNFYTENLKDFNSYKDIFYNIEDSNSFILTYNPNNTEELSKEIKENWTKITH